MPHLQPYPLPHRFHPPISLKLHLSSASMASSSKVMDAAWCCELERQAQGGSLDDEVLELPHCWRAGDDELQLPHGWRAGARRRTGRVGEQATTSCSGGRRPGRRVKFLFIYFCSFLDLPLRRAYCDELARVTWLLSIWRKGIEKWGWRECLDSSGIAAVGSFHAFFLWWFPAIQRTG
jgi:hypothetical protein